MVAAIAVPQNSAVEATLHSKRMKNWHEKAIMWETLNQAFPDGIFILRVNCKGAKLEVCETSTIVKGTLSICLGPPNCKWILQNLGWNTNY